MVFEPAHLLVKDSFAQRLKGLLRGWLVSIHRAEGEFQRNLADWSRGGPGPRGWTRTGPPVQTPECHLVGVKRRLIDADDCLAKNRAETLRWHVGFLGTYRSGGDLRETAYWREYLQLRFSPEVAAQRSARFVALYENIARHGCRPGSYAWLADFASAPGLQPHFGFRYFRFDGAHRLSCQYVLGIRQIPSLVFSLRT